jgi:hypothetical protein
MSVQTAENICISSFMYNKMNDKIVNQPKNITMGDELNMKTGCRYTDRTC